jgi:hypothetical protein
MNDDRKIVFWISKGILMTFCSLTFEWEWLLIILLIFEILFRVIYDGMFLSFNMESFSGFLGNLHIYGCFGTWGMRGIAIFFKACSESFFYSF